MENLGYSEYFESKRKEQNLEQFSVARVITEYKGAYKVKNLAGEYIAKITGKQMFDAKSREDYPAVGDWVAIKEIDKENVIIHGTLPRRTTIKRKSNDRNETQIISTNIDVAFIVESIGRDFNLNRFERYFAIATDGGVKSTVIINKIDLISKEELYTKITEFKERFKDVEVILTSTVKDIGLEELSSYILPGKTYCFLGSSGVGKSSLINKLLSKNAINTKEVGFQNKRGKHTTTSREMYFLKNGGIVIDNPGMREVGMTDADTGVKESFDEIILLANECKYTKCTHTQEPGCRILEELKAGKIDEDKYLNYLNLKKEVEYYELSEAEKKEKDQKFGKFLKKAKKDLKKFGHKDY